jgi:peptide subunit release factor 1 (eRF1)
VSVTADASQSLDPRSCSSGLTQGNTRDVLHKFTVDLPKKHGRGGQSAVRFARIRMEKRHNYVRKVTSDVETTRRAPVGRVLFSLVLAFMGEQVASLASRPV